MEARGGECWVPFAGEGAELAGGAPAGAKAPRQAGGAGHAGKELGSGSPWCHAGVMLRAQSVAGQGGLWGPGWRQALWSGQETRLTKGQGAEGWLGPGSVGLADPACVRHQERGGDESC